MYLSMLKCSAWLNVNYFVKRSGEVVNINKNKVEEINSFLNHSINLKIEFACLVLLKRDNYPFFFS